MKNTHKCLIPGCEKLNSGSRGLCNTHYLILAKMAKIGKITWEKLELAGLAVTTYKVKASPETDMLMEILRNKNLI